MLLSGDLCFAVELSRPTPTPSRGELLVLALALIAGYSVITINSKTPPCRRIRATIEKRRENEGLGEN